MTRLVAMLVGLLLAATGAAAQETVERQVKGQPGKDIRLGVFFNVKDDCTSGPLPAVKLLAPPTNGNVTVKQAKLRRTNYKNCLAIEVPAYVAFYRSAAGYIGTDIVTIEIKFPEGKTHVWRITVTLANTPAGQPI